MMMMMMIIKATKKDKTDVCEQLPHFNSNQKVQEELIYLFILKFVTNHIMKMEQSCYIHQSAIFIK